MVESRSDAGEKSFRIKQDDKFFNWLISRESSQSKNSSSRINTGANCAIPFTWESQPGTPKHAFRETSIPPLTPPPSFGYSKSSKKKPLQKHSRASLLHLLLRRLVNKKFRISLLSSSSSSSSSARSAPVTPSSTGRYHGKKIRYPSAFDSVSDGEEYVIKSHGSTLCFGIGSKSM